MTCREGGYLPPRAGRGVVGRATTTAAAACGRAAVVLFYLLHFYLPPPATCGLPQSSIFIDLGQELPFSRLRRLHAFSSGGLPIPYRRLPAVRLPVLWEGRGGRRHSTLSSPAGFGRDALGDERAGDDVVVVYLGFWAGGLAGRGGGYTASRFLRELLPPPTAGELPF